jgi:hypothetical protein
MATQAIDATAATGGRTYSQSSVDTDGTVLTGPPAASQVWVRMTAAGVFSVGGEGAAEVPLDANSWTQVWAQSPGLTSTPRAYVAPSTGTATVYARVL